jgi:hypothetical protein
MPIVIVAVLALLQLVYVGYTFMETSHAARAGARAWAVDGDKDWWTSAAKDELPESWRSKTDVEEIKDGGKAVGVRVTVQVPSVLPIPNDLKRKLKVVDEKRTKAE